MAPKKKVSALIKLQIQAGKANPAPPAAALLKKAAGVEKGTENPLTHKVGSVTKAQVREIAEIKMEDLSARDIEAGMKIIEGTARSMGITVTD